MKRISIIVSVLLSFCAQAQVFTGPTGAIQNNGQETYFNLSVSGLSPGQLDNSFGIEEVCLDITHPALEEIQVALQSPGGIVVELTEGSSCKGVDYTSTCFSNSGSTSITLGTAPFSGSYKPVGYLGRFNNGQASNGTWKLIVKDYLAFANAGNLNFWSIKFSNTPPPALNFTSSSLPIVVINTHNQGISDTKITADLGIINNGTGNTNHPTDPWNDYSGKVKIDLRGNSSKHFEKKPYALETCDNAGTTLPASLLGMPIESDWNLIAMYQDKSLIRVPMTYDLARQMGHYAARVKMVEVVINNEYRGVYALTEKLKRDKNRIDVAKLTPDESTEPGITGGYIFKIDRPDEPGWYSLLSGEKYNSHFFYQFVYPNEVNITVPQSDYIKSFVDSFETVMNSSYYADPWVGYQKYIAIGSFVDYFIINELSKNVDAYRLSTYLYKHNTSKSNKMHIGPVWDYDLAWHNCNFSNSNDPAGWEYQLSDTTYPTPKWWKLFMQDSTFRNTLYCHWTEYRQNVLSDAHIYSYIDSSAQALDEPEQRNFTQWPIIGAYIYGNPQNQANASYQGEVSDLKNWVASRLGWMDWAITGHCPFIGIKENTNTSTINVSPNPFQSSTTFDIHLTEEASVSLKIINLMGQEIAAFPNQLRSPGDYKIHFDREKISAGVYFYQFKINNSTKTGKIVIQ